MSDSPVKTLAVVVDVFTLGEMPEKQSGYPTFGVGKPEQVLKKVASGSEVST